LGDRESTADASDVARNAAAGFGGGPIKDVRRQSLGAFRKGIEEGNAAPHLGRTFGRGWSLFNDYFPRFYLDFHRDFLAVTVRARNAQRARCAAPCRR
jgi:hypothetical protein